MLKDCKYLKDLKDFDLRRGHRRKNHSEHWGHGEAVSAVFSQRLQRS
jgi:hypothetical protein